ncbi:hypothetical protein BH23CHL5_BH23CHL5_21130 [soil metagenome]
MSERAFGLAQRFEAASLEVEKLITSSTDQQLQMKCTSERCSAIALACHVGRVHKQTVEWITKLQSGKGLADLPMNEINSTNESWFSQDDFCSKAEAMHVIATNRSFAAEFVRGLSDADLDRTGSFGPFNGAIVSVQTVIEQILIGDPLAHLSSIQSATGAVEDPHASSVS